MQARRENHERNRTAWAETSGNRKVQQCSTAKNTKITETKKHQTSSFGLAFFVFFAVNPGAFSAVGISRARRGNSIARGLSFSISPRFPRKNALASPVLKEFSR